MYNKIHIWLGSTTKDEEEYYEYFDQDENIAQFSRDIGVEEYDEDFSCFLPPFSESISVLELLKETDISESDLELAIQKCTDLKLFKGNCVFYMYVLPYIEIQKPYKENYNGAKYLGIYNVKNSSK